MRQPADLPSRRRLFAGLAVVPALTFPGLARADASSPDTLILALGQRHATLTARAAAIWAQASAADLRAEASRPALPDALNARPGDLVGSGARVGLGQPYGREQVASWRRALAQEGPLSFTALNGPRHATRAREVVEAWDQHTAALELVSVAHGVRRLEREADAVDRERYRVEAAMLAATATTPAGWRVKARIAAELLGSEPDGTYEDAAVRSLLADLVGDAELRPGAV